MALFVSHTIILLGFAILLFGKWSKEKKKKINEHTVGVGAGGAMESSIAWFSSRAAVCG